MAEIPNAPVRFGPLVATTGTFSGAVSATTGTFSGAVSMAGLTATTGAFSGAVTALSVTATGNLRVGAGNVMGTTGRGGFESPADGVYNIRNEARTGFDRLQFGGTTSSFPALKRSSATLQCRLADDSANAGFRCSTITTNQGNAWDLQGANVVSPTSPNRTVAIVIDGTTYYLHAKTTNN